MGFRRKYNCHICGKKICMTAHKRLKDQFWLDHIEKKKQVKMWAKRLKDKKQRKLNIE